MRELAPPVAQGFMDGLAASYALEKAEGTATGPASFVVNDVTRTLDALVKITGDHQAFAREGGTSKWGAYQLDVNMRRLDAADDLIADLRANDMPGAASLMTGKEIREKAQKAIGTVRRRAENAGIGGSLVGGMAGAMSDPVNLMTLPLGAPSAVGFATAMLAEAGINSGLELVLQPGVQKSLRGLGVEPSASVAERALMAGMGAAVFTGVGRGLVGLLDKAIGAGKLKGSRIAAARDAIDEALVEKESNPFGPAGQRVHSEAIVEAKRQVAAGQAVDVAQVTLRQRMGQGFREAALELGPVVHKAVAPLDLPGSARGLLLHAAAELKARGVDARLERGADSFALIAGENRIDLPADATAFEAREALNAATTAVNIERVRLTKREETAREFLPQVAEVMEGRRVKADSIRGRTVDGVVLNDGGEQGRVQPFKTKQAALAHARSRLPGDWEAVRVGKGFGLSAENPEAARFVADAGGYGLIPAESPVSVKVRQMFNEVNDVQVSRQDILEHEANTARAKAASETGSTDVSPAEVDQASAVATRNGVEDVATDPREPLAPVDTETLSATVAEFEAKFGNDATVNVRTLDGAGKEITVTKSAREVFDDLREDGEAEEVLRDYLNCMSGVAVDG